MPLGQPFQGDGAAAQRRAAGRNAEWTIGNSRISLPGQREAPQPPNRLTHAPGFPRLSEIPKMDDKSFMKKRAVLTVAGLILGAHLAALVFLRAWPAVSLVFAPLCTLFAGAACYDRSTRTSGPVRRKWDFVASAMSLMTIGLVLNALRHFWPGFELLPALGPEFYFLVYGIPVLLAISTSNEDRDTVIFTAIDSLQALFGVALVYIELALSPLLSAAHSGTPGLVLIYGVGSWTLAAAALLRLLAHPRGEEKALYRILLVYLLCFALLATPWRGASLFQALPHGLYRGLLADFTFLVLGVASLLHQAKPEPKTPAIETNSFALVLNNGSPILFTLAVLALGAMVARLHFVLGISAIGLSLLTYCFRAALLQSAYMRAQHALTRSQFALREANARLQQLSLHDALTGLPNRRQFDQALDLEWSRAQRNRRPLSLLILDVDCFKSLNDLYGHQAGDDCLQRIGSALQMSLRRAGEVVARYGGEEFAAILPDADTSGALSVAETMRTAVLDLRVLHEGSAVDRFVTISAGVASVYPTGDASPATLIAAADEALYRAKSDGRNRVEIHEAAVLLR